MASANGRRTPILSKYKVAGLGCNFSGHRYCVDATEESPRLGRLINHSRLHPNCYVKVIPIDQQPRLALFAKTDIPP
ncbi:unnamed protein product, partial [Dibothriocephalus latus]